MAIMAVEPSSHGLTASFGWSIWCHLLPCNVAYYYHSCILNIGCIIPDRLGSMSRRSLCMVSCPGEVSVCVIMCCDSLCVPEEPPCVCHCCVSRWSHRVCVGLLVDAYQCRQLSAQLAPPSFIGKDVIVQGPYLGVCFKIKMYYRYYSSYIPSCCF